MPSTPLRVRVDPARIAAGVRTRFAVRVTAPLLGRRRAVAGARVRLLGAVATTDAHGRAVLRAGPPARRSLPPARQLARGSRQRPRARRERPARRPRARLARKRLVSPKDGVASLAPLVTRYLRILGGLLAALALPVLLAACGGGVPGDAVATVDGNDITKTEFNRNVVITAKSSSQTPGQAVVVPDPPDFKKCAAAKAKADAQVLHGAQAGDRRATSSSARPEYKALKEQTMGLLIQAQWVEGEAKAQGITVTDKQVQARFAQQKKASFPKASDFQTFLKQSGLTQKDILERVKLDLLASKLRTKVTKGKDKVTEAQVTAYYTKNPSQFTSPEKRDILMIMTRTKAKADAAAKALQERHVVQGRGQEVLDRPADEVLGRPAQGRHTRQAGREVRGGRVHRRQGQDRRPGQGASSATTSSRSSKITPKSKQQLEPTSRRRSVSS